MKRNRMKLYLNRFSHLFLSLFVAASLFGCGSGSSDSSGSTAQSITSSQISSESKATSDSQTSSVQSEQTSEEWKEPNPAILPITLADIPAYSGQPYVEINNNVPYFEENEKTTTAFQHYFDLDDLGRVTLAYGSLGQEIMPEEERGDISSVHPTGWVQNRYDFIKDGQALYNRSHLIAFSLSGQNANPKNLMTGTRYMNTKGMQPFEMRTLDFIKETDMHVMYQVTPMFDGNNLVADGVLIQAKSVEDNGKGLSFNVFCYNVQPGVEINYATGDNRASDDAATTTSQSSGNAGAADAVAQDYVLNTNSHKFHRPDCESVDDMSAKNRQDVHQSREELIAAGYTPCKRCNP
ncbi:MAG: DNA/RNA non-specific endonuclease [Allobaculum sp.]